MSSSSSEFNYYEDTKYSRKNARQMYSNLRQPLIYYTQVQDPYHTEQCNPSCFTKAFQWYIQENDSRKKKPGKNKDDVKRFAAWLDNKYNQFLIESEANAKPTKAAHRGDEANFAHNSRPRKKFKRFRSPWRKRKHNENIDEGSAFIKSCTSIKTIWKKKNVIQTTSECRSPKTMANCNSLCLKEATDRIPTQNTDKIGTSRSLLSFLKHNDFEVNMNIPLDFSEDKPNKEHLWIPFPFVRKHEVETILWDSLLNEDFELQDQNENETKLVSSTKRNKDVVCQCPAPNLSKDVSSQYNDASNGPASPRCADTCIDNSPVSVPRLRDQKYIEKEIVSPAKENGNVNHNIVSPREQNQNVLRKQVICQCAALNVGKEISCQCDDYFSNKLLQQCCCPRDTSEAYNERQYRKLPQMKPHNFVYEIAKERAPISETRECSISVSSNKNVQTSDYPINIERPLYMKIICPDKLYDGHKYVQKKQSNEK